MITDEQFLKLFNQIVRTKHLEGYKEISMEYHLGYLHGMEYLFDYIKRQTLKENHIVDTNEMVSSQTEISDEEIDKCNYTFFKDGVYFIADEISFKAGAKWYREQLKKKQ